MEDRTTDDKAKRPSEKVGQRKSENSRRSEMIRKKSYQQHEKKKSSIRKSNQLLEGHALKGCSKGSIKSYPPQMLKKIERGLIERNPSLSVELIKASTEVTGQRICDMKKDTGTVRDGYCDKVNRQEEPQIKIRRIRLPTKPKSGPNIWSLLRNSIGKDIGSLVMPVCFSEPISMLQRLAEDFEYSHLLDKAAVCNDPGERLALVSAFVVSAYSSTGERFNKPFSPLTGETYEMDRRDDLGWRLMSEQVLPSPPTSAQFCEGRHWKCWKTFSVTTMFRGKYMKVSPTGTSHLRFSDSSRLTWGRINSTVNNILFGKMWLDNVGETEVMDHMTGHKCLLVFLPYDSYIKENRRRIQGKVTDREGETRWLLDGCWDSHVNIYRVTTDNKEEGAEPVTEPGITVWQVTETPLENRIYYNFTLFSCQLNEPEDFVAPTDSRMREDIRLMEEGTWEKADTLKKKLEQQDKENQDFAEPVWFTLRQEPTTGDNVFFFTDTYWKAKAVGDWSKCPDIFTS